MPDLHQIPHLDEIAHHGEYHGVGKRVTETFADRYHHQNKVVPSLEDAIRLTGLRDGMTISFHHHFRNGDHIVNMVLDKLAEMGFHDLKLAASSLSAIHAPLIRHIQNGVITHIETSGMRGELAEAVSRGLMDCPVVFRSHGGRASAIRTGELHIDVAFLGAPSCDPYGNANGYSRDDDEGIACGSLGYARPDAAYADEVVIITNHLVAYPNAPWAIPEDEVDYVVVTDDIGDPKGIMSGATRYTKDPKELLIARNAANVIDAAGYLYDGFSMQMGSGGASLATARFLRQKMLDRGIHCRFALGGITGQITAMHEEGLIDRILDVQSFDLDAAKSLKNNHFHHQIGATYYASYLVDSAVDQLDFVVLSALEIDTDFNVNVLTGSDGVIRGAIGGHPDTAEGASLSVVVAPLTRGRIPTIVKHVNTVVTPGDAVDVVVTDQGIAVNPRRPDVKEKLEKAELHVFTIEQLQQREEAGECTALLLADDGALLACGTRSGKVLRQIAVSPEAEGGGACAEVVSALLQDATAHGVPHPFLFTAPGKSGLFRSLGFTPLAQTADMLMMEHGRGGLRRFLSGIPVGPERPVGSIVCHANPFTLGHRHLIAYAAARCAQVLVFVLSDTDSLFPPELRLRLVREGTADLPNVRANPGGDYLISPARRRQNAIST